RKGKINQRDQVPLRRSHIVLVEVGRHRCHRKVLALGLLPGQVEPHPRQIHVRDLISLLGQPQRIPSRSPSQVERQAAAALQSRHRRREERARPVVHCPPAERIDEVVLGGDLLLRRAHRRLLPAPSECQAKQGQPDRPARTDVHPLPTRTAVPRSDPAAPPFSPDKIRRTPRSRPRTPPPARSRISTHPPATEPRPKSTASPPPRSRSRPPLPAAPAAW